MLRSCVPGSPAIEIAGRSVVHSLPTRPGSVGGEHQDSQQSADRVAQPPRAEKRFVTAVVEDDEEPHQESRREDGQQRGDPLYDFINPDDRVQSTTARQAPGARKG